MSFFWITIVYGFIAALLFALMIVQMIKVPTNDYFVFKGSIYLCFATFFRVCACIYVFFTYQRYQNGVFEINHEIAFGAQLTQATFELPLFFMLMTFYSLIFAQYKLYLVIQEMLGINIA